MIHYLLLPVPDLLILWKYEIFSLKPTRVSEDDFANLLFNFPIYTPESVSSDPGINVSKADPIIYSSLDESSSLYIAPMDSQFQAGDEVNHIPLLILILISLQLKVLTMRMILLQMVVK